MPKIGKMRNKMKITHFEVPKFKDFRALEDKGEEEEIHLNTIVPIV